MTDAVEFDETAPRKRLVNLASPLDTVVLVGVYVWSRNVMVSILTHGVINVVMLFVLPAFL